MPSSALFWHAYDDETNFGGGTGGADYAKTASGQGDLNAAPYPYDESQHYPSLKYHHESKKAVGQGLHARQVIVTGPYIDPGKRIQHLQDAVWLSYAISGTINAVPDGAGKSWTEIFKEGARYFQAFGCFMTEYTLTIQRGKPDREEFEYYAFDVSSSEYAGAQVAFNTGAAKSEANHVITYDGVTLSNVTKCVIHIKRTYTGLENLVATQMKYPKLADIHVTVDIDFEDDEADHMYDVESSSAADPGTFAVTGIGASTFQATYMAVTESNQFEVPVPGLKENHLKLEVSGASAVTCA